MDRKIVGIIFLSLRILILKREGYIMRTLNVISAIAFVLLVIGGINWLSIGLFNYDFVMAIFGGAGIWMSRVIFSIVGISALWLICYVIVAKDRLSLHQDRA